MSELSIQRINQVLVSPRFTEKATDGTEKNNIMTFNVAMDATKSEIAQSVKQMFGLDVVSVKTLINKPKVKRDRRTGKFGKQNAFKKAMVRLSAGSPAEFDFTAAEKKLKGDKS